MTFSELKNHLEEMDEGQLEQDVLVLSMDQFMLVELATTGNDVFVLIPEMDNE